MLYVTVPFLLCFTLSLRAISKFKPPGDLYSERPRFTGGFFALRVWGTYIWRGLLSKFYGSSQLSTLVSDFFL